jgi:hypothetical protein
LPIYLRREKKQRQRKSVHLEDIFSNDGLYKNSI